MNLIKLPPFLYCENKTEMPGAGIVLATVFPWIIGRVVNYPSFETMAHTLAKSDLIAYCMVPGYNICIQFAGTLRDSHITVNSQLKEQLNSTMVKMAQFYLDSKIKDKPGYYDRLFLSSTHA